MKKNANNYLEFGGFYATIQRPNGCGRMGFCKTIM